MKEALAKQSRYALGHSEQELERLIRQAEIFEPFTRQLLQQAGISKGMCVLDVGCGSGDVTALASDGKAENSDCEGGGHFESRRTDTE